MELWQRHYRKWEEKKNFVAEIQEEIFKKVLRLQYFYNIFTTNFKWQVIIIRLKNNLSIKIKFELIITNHL